MALIRFGGVASEARGSLNGVVFSRTRAGAIIRNRTNPIQPNTPSQSLQRAAMQVATDLYKALAPEDLQAWSTAPSDAGFTSQNALGESYTPSGKQVFTQCAMNLQSAGIAVTSNPPDVSKFLNNPNLPAVGFGNAPYVTIDLSVGPAPFTFQQIGLNVSPTGTGTLELLVFATAPLLPTIKNYRKYLRQIGSFTATTDVAPEYTTVFPGIDPEQVEGLMINFAVKAVNTDTGLASAMIMLGGAAVPEAI